MGKGQERSEVRSQTEKSEDTLQGIGKSGKGRGGESRTMNYKISRIPLEGNGWRSGKSIRKAANNYWRG